MKRKTVITALILISIFFTLVPSVHARYFTDTSRSMGSETFDAINYVSDNGFVLGIEDTQFGPETTLTRAMFVTILYRYSGDTGTYTNPFTDVPNNAYYKNAVGWAYQNGIVKGTTNTTFSPSANLNRQQVLTFFHRYALKFDSQFSNTKGLTITSHPDYEIVESYARTPFAWAKAYHILPVNDSGYLYPYSAVKRKEVALFFTRYGLQVRQFPSEDLFSFKNGVDFCSIYRIQSSVYNKLTNDVYNKYSADPQKVASTCQIIDSYRNKESNGSCFGMSVVLYLDKVGKIDFNKNTCNVSQMNAVSKPYSDPVVESVINYYHFTQFMPGISRHSYVQDVQSNVLTLRNGPGDIYEDVNASGPVILRYFFDSGDGVKGHAIVVLSCNSPVRVASNNSTSYGITYYDPNAIGIKQGEMIVYNNTGAVKIGDRTLTGMDYMEKSYLEFFNSFDIDSAYNNVIASTVQNAAPSWGQNIEDTGTATLILDYVPFQIENAEGQQLVCDGSEITGDLEILAKDLVANGPDSPCGLLLTVPYSDRFSYDTTYENAFFAVSSQQYYCSASGTGIRQIMASKENGLLVEGSNMDIRASGCISQDLFSFVAVEGTADHIAEIQFNDCGADVCGFTGEGTVTMTAMLPTVTTDEQTCCFTESMSVDIAKGSSMKITENMER